MDKRTLFIILLVGIVGMSVWGFASFTVTSEVVSAGSTTNNNVVTPFRQNKPKEKETTENPESGQSNLLLWAIVGVAVLGLGTFLLVQLKQETRRVPRSGAAWDEPYVPPAGGEPIPESGQGQEGGQAAP